LGQYGGRPLAPCPSTHLRTANEHSPAESVKKMMTPTGLNADGRAAGTAYLMVPYKPHTKYLSTNVICRRISGEDNGK